MRRIRVAQFGLGSVGLEALRPWLEIMRAEDNAPAKAGRPLAEVTGLAAPDLRLHLDAAEPHGPVVFRGRLPSGEVVRGGGSGGEGTFAALVNVVPRLLASAPGLQFATDGALSCWCGGVGERPPRDSIGRDREWC
jgi:hypothetical protein